MEDKSITQSNVALDPVGLKPGEIFWNNYRVIGIIGRGGVSSVYKAENIETKEQVAIKILHAQKLRDEELVRRFVREAQNTIKLDDPHIVRIYEWGIDKLERPFIIMEYLSGETLAKRIGRTNGMAARKAVDIMEQVCSAMSEAHAKGIIHRDLKPENIMLTNQNGVEDWVKVFDFGIAKMEAPDETGSQQQASLTRTGAILGTPQYMSPEQLRGKKADARSDVYALGVIMYEMLTGKPPFASKNTAEIVVGHLNVIPESPTALRRDLSIPEELSEVVLRALCKNAWERPVSVQEFRNSMLKSLDRSKQAQQGQDPGQAPQAVAGSSRPTFDPRRKICPNCGAVNSPTTVKYCLKCGQDNTGRWQSKTASRFSMEEIVKSLCSVNVIFTLFVVILAWEAYSFASTSVDLSGRYHAAFSRILFFDADISPVLHKRIGLTGADMIFDQRDKQIGGMINTSFGQANVEGSVTEINPFMLSYDIYAIANRPEGELRMEITGTIDKIVHAENWQLRAKFHGKKQRPVSDTVKIKLKALEN